MTNFEWIEQQGVKILFMRIASNSIFELEKKIDEFKAIISQQPKHSLLTISDVEGGHYDREMKNLLSSFTRDNEPYIKMSAVIGVKGLQQVLYKGVLRMSGRTNLVLKNSKEEAINFLLSQ